MLRDAELILRLGGFKHNNFTFSDLLVNENYKETINLYKYLILNNDHIYIIGNYRAKDSLFAKKNKFIPIRDNFFNCYDKQLLEIQKKIKNIPSGSIIFCSASSLTNIIGYNVWKKRQDVTLIDAGSSINFLLNLDGNRLYQTKYSSLYDILTLKFLLNNKMRL